MAINLSTPRYVAPDVASAATAAENISASQRRTNLADRQAADERRQNEERNRQAELQLSINMMTANNKIAHDNAILPHKIAEAQQSIANLALQNTEARQRVAYNEHKYALDYELAMTKHEKDVSDAETARVNLFNTRQQAALQPLLTAYLRTVSDVSSRVDWGVNKELELPPVPDFLTGAALTTAVNAREKAMTIARSQGADRDAKRKRTQLEHIANSGYSLSPKQQKDPEIVSGVLHKINAQKIRDFLSQEGVDAAHIEGVQTGSWFIAFNNEDGIFDEAKAKSYAQTVVKAQQDFEKKTEAMEKDKREHLEGIFSKLLSVRMGSDGRGTTILNLGGEAMSDAEVDKNRKEIRDMTPEQLYKEAVKYHEQIWNDPDKKPKPPDAPPITLVPDPPATPPATETPTETDAGGRGPTVVPAGGTARVGVTYTSPTVGPPALEVQDGYEWENTHGSNEWKLVKIRN